MDAKRIDLDLVREISACVNVPVVASGGAGRPDDIVDVLLAGADAALVAGIVHDRVETIASIKEAMVAGGLPVRSELAA